MRCGIDWSMSSPAVCFVYDGTIELYNVHKTKKLQGVHREGSVVIYIDPYPAWNTAQERYDALSDWAVTLIKSKNPSNIVIEGYSFSSTGAVFDLAENCGLLKWKLWKEGLKFDLPSPSEVKKQRTGKGNADKYMMVKVAEDELKLDFSKILCLDVTQKVKNPISDLADAYHMAMFERKV